MLERRTQQVKRACSPSVQKINAGSHRPFSGVRGPVHSTSEDELQHSSQPGRSNSISPIIVCNQGASEQHEDYQQVDWHHVSPDGAQESACLHGSVKRNRHQHEREQQYFYWQEDLAIVILVPWLISSSTGQSFSTEYRMTSETESMQQTRNAGAATQLNTYRLCYHQQPSHMPAHLITSLCTSQNLSVPAAAPALLCILLAETVCHPLHARPLSGLINSCW